MALRRRSTQQLVKRFSRLEFLPIRKLFCSPYKRDKALPSPSLCFAPLQERVSNFGFLLSMERSSLFGSSDLSPLGSYWVQLSDKKVFSPCLWIARIQHGVQPRVTG